jgi:hypothetical protein
MNFNFPTWHPKSSKELLAIPPLDWEKLLPWILAGAVALCLIILLWVYVASVYRFVLFDSVLYDRCELRGSWGRWEPCGRSYFYWSLGLSVISLIGSGLLIGATLLIAWRAGWFRQPGQHVMALILGGTTLLFILVAFFVLSALVGLFAKDFCVPIMAMEKVGVLDAWWRLFPMLAMEKMAFAGYVLMKIVLAIGAAIIFGIVTLLSLILLLIPLGIAAAVIFLVGKAMGLTMNIAAISFLVVVGGVVLVGIIYLIALINTPAMVFFQSYVLHFMGSRYPTLGAAVFPPPPETPPPPPAPAPIIEPSMG